MKYSGTPFRLKAKRITFLGTRSKAFDREISKYKKQLLIFGFQFFAKSPQNKHSISYSPCHNPILHFINIHHVTQTLTQNLLVQFKSMFKQLYSPIRFRIKGIPFPLKISTNEFNINPSGNLYLSKISLNMFVKDFKHLSPPTLNNSIATPDGLLASSIFPDFHTSSTSILLTPYYHQCYHSIHFQHSSTFAYTFSSFFFDHPHLFSSPHFQL